MSFSFQTSQKDLEQSYKTKSLRLFRKSKVLIIAKFNTIDLVICCHSREGKTTYYSRIHAVTVLDLSIISKHVIIHERFSILTKITNTINTKKIFKFYPKKTIVLFIILVII